MCSKKAGDESEASLAQTTRYRGAPVRIVSGARPADETDKQWWDYLRLLRRLDPNTRVTIEHGPRIQDHVRLQEVELPGDLQAGSLQETLCRLHTLRKLGMAHVVRAAQSMNPQVAA